MQTDIQIELGHKESCPSFLYQVGYYVTQPFTP